MPALLLKKLDVLFLRASDCSLLTLELVYRAGWLKRSRRRLWVSESYFLLPSNEQQEALQYASAQSGRPVHLLEKISGLFGLLKRCLSRKPEQT